MLFNLLECLLNAVVGREFILDGEKSGKQSKSCLLYINFCFFCLIQKVIYRTFKMNHGKSSSETSLRPYIIYCTLVENKTSRTHIAINRTNSKWHN